MPSQTKPHCESQPSLVCQTGACVGIALACLSLGICWLGLFNWVFNSGALKANMIKCIGVWPWRPNTDSRREWWNWASQTDSRSHSHARVQEQNSLHLICSDLFCASLRRSHFSKWAFRHHHHATERKMYRGVNQGMLTKPLRASAQFLLGIIGSLIVTAILRLSNKCALKSPYSRDR